MILKKSSSFLLSAIALGLLAMTGCADFGGNLGFEINAQEEQQGEPGKLGGPCRTDGSAECEAGLVCDSSTKTCQKPGAGELDGDCLSGAGRKCKGDLVCSEGACVEACPSGRLIHPVSRECVDAQCDQHGTPPNLNCGTGKFCADKFCIREEDRCELTECKAGFRCEAGACVVDCGAEQACNGVCCGKDQICFNGTICGDKPKTDGDSCNLENVEYCPASAFCDETLMSCVEYSQLPAPPTTCLAKLGYDYELVEVLTWNKDFQDAEGNIYNQVMTTPLAFDIDNDGIGYLIFAAYDGKKSKYDTEKDEEKRKELIANSYHKAVLYVIKGVADDKDRSDTEERWNSQNTDKFDSSNDRNAPFFVNASVTMALGDIDPSQKDGPEIIAITHQDEYTATNPAQLIAINAKSAEVKWRSDITKDDPYRYPKGVGPDYALSIADLDGDGVPEILTPFEVRSGEDGRLLCKYGNYSTFATVDFSAAISRAPIAVDLDGKGNLEIVGGGRVREFKRDGSICPTIGTDYDAFKDDDGLRMVAVANIDDKNGNKPEIIVTNRCKVYIFNHENTLLAEKQFPEFASCKDRKYGGAPTVADFNGNGKLEIGVAGPQYYTIYKYDGNTLDEEWKYNTYDSSGKTGATAFDLKGDGIVEIIYNDEKYFRIFRRQAKTTMLVADTKNDSGTIIENPIVVDLNNDGSAEIVVATNQWGLNGNSYTHGLRVFKEKHNRWVGTRPIWSQHAFHPTFINDDGTIPANPPKYWEKGWSNNFRQNLQNTSKLAAELKPEFDSISVDGTCGTSNKRRINFRILNDGDKEVPAGRFKTLVSISKAGQDNWVETVKIDKNQGAVPAKGSLDAYVEVTLPPALNNEDLDIKIEVDVNEQVVECIEDDNEVIVEGVAANVVSPNQNLALEITSLDDLQCVDPGTLNLKLKIEYTGTTAIDPSSGVKVEVELYVGSGGQFADKDKQVIDITDELAASSPLEKEVKIAVPEEYRGKLLEVYGVVGSDKVIECTMDDNRADYNQPLLCY